MTSRKKVYSFAAIVALVLISLQPLSAQTLTASADPAPAPAAAAAAAPDPSATPPPSKSKYSQDEGRVGAGFRLSSLGFGGEVAVRVMHRANVRGGFNFFSYSKGYDDHGIHYDGNLRWASGEAHFDYFPFAHSFHLSPGLIAYNGNHVDASASVAGGNTFTLSGVQYESDPANPVTGTAKLSFNKVAPTIMFGFGNLVPRNGKHFSFNIEAGIAFSGSPKIALNLIGSACTPGNPPTNCQNVATNSSIQSNVQGEQSRISNDLSPFKYYPLISGTIGYRF